MRGCEGDTPRTLIGYVLAAVVSAARALWQVEPPDAAPVRRGVERAG